MRRLLIKGLCLLFLVFILDRALGLLIPEGAMKRELDSRLGKILEGKVKVDILILGSSRAARDFIASELEKSSGLSAYNLGYPGSNIDFHEMLLDLIVESGHLPKKIILAVDDDAELIGDPTINFRFDVLYPYVKHDRINEIICERRKISRLATRLSSCYRQRPNLRKAIEYILRGRLKPDPLTKIEPDGSMPLHAKSITYKEMSYNSGSRRYPQGKESGYLREKFEKFVGRCDENNIQLIVLFSPNYFAPTVGFKERIKGLAGGYPMYLDFSREFLDKDLYYDAYHLDHKGASLFSTKLGQRILAIDRKG